MPPSASIIIQNKSGSHENYAIYAAPPQVTGFSEATIFPVAIYSVLVPKGGRSQIEFSPTYSAICGTYNGPPKPGVQTNVSQSQSINLVKMGLDDEVSSQGSKVVLKVNNDRQLYFGSPVGSSDGPAGTFELLTEPFDGAQGKENGYFVGVAIDSDVGLSPMGTWMPSPNVRYVVRPSLQFYVVSGSRLDVGTLIDQGQLNAQACNVDFSQHPRHEIVLVHNSNGQIVIQQD